MAEPVRLEAAAIRRHYHALPYATLVLEGSYEEAGDQGRYRVSAGDILLHPAFSAHQDLIGSARTYVLDLPLPFDGRRWPGLAQLPAAEDVIRFAARDLRAARELMLEGLVATARVADDPADRLADALSADPSLSIGEWARSNGYSREWLSRRFTRLYGIDSAVFRAEARARLGWRRVVESDDPLAQIAAGIGFADQAHMTRAIGRLTGHAPRWWRQHSSVTSVQEER